MLIILLVLVKLPLPLLCTRAVDGTLGVALRADVLGEVLGEERPARPLLPARRGLDERRPAPIPSMPRLGALPPAGARALGRAEERPLDGPSVSDRMLGGRPRPTGVGAVALPKPAGGMMPLPPPPRTQRRERTL